MSVAFDWGLAVQIFLTPISYTFINLSNSYKIPGVSQALVNVLLFVVAWPVAFGVALFGEMVRRGRYWTLKIQIAANALLAVVGVVSLVNLYNGIRAGNLWPVITEVILVVFSPLIAWRMSRPATFRWFKNVSIAEARRRHGGSWVLWIALWAIAGGVLQTIAGIK